MAWTLLAGGITSQPRTVSRAVGTWSAQSGSCSESLTHGRPSGIEGFCGAAFGLCAGELGALDFPTGLVCSVDGEVEARAVAGRFLELGL